MIKLMTTIVGVVVFVHVAGGQQPDAVHGLLLPGRSVRQNQTAPRCLQGVYVRCVQGVYVRCVQGVYVRCVQGV